MRHNEMHSLDALTYARDKYRIQRHKTFLFRNFLAFVYDTPGLLIAREPLKIRMAVMRSSTTRTRPFYTSA